MSDVITKGKISVSKAEYTRLKRLDEQFGKLLAYLENLVDIKSARKEVKQKKLISQEALFRKLGF